MSDSPEYSAPAIDKALDILELLANSSGSLSQLEIAIAIGRSPGQIFRPLMRLEKRGYIFRDKQSGLYQLSMHIFDLAHRQEPLRSLLTVAVPVMRDLAADIGQSCNLGTIDAGQVRIVTQVESPADFGFHVRVGALFDLTDTATGMVLAAYSEQSYGVDEELLETIRQSGGFVRPDSAQPGITDVVVPVMRSNGREAIAALTVPYVSTSYSRYTVEVVQAMAALAAKKVQSTLGI